MMYRNILSKIIIWHQLEALMKSNLLQLDLKFLILCYYGDLSLQISVHRAIPEIWRADESEARAVFSSDVVPQP